MLNNEERMMSSAGKQKMVEEVLEGRPVTAFEIIDAHSHLGYWHNFNIPRRTAADMVHAMDRVGIRCCVSAAHAGISADYRIGNSQVIEAMRAFPGRILGYCCINPNYPDDEIRDELKRCFDAGMTAIKYHPSCHKYPIDADCYRVAWEYADEHSLCVLTHTEPGAGTCGVAQAGKCAKLYPNAKVILGHSGFGYEGARRCIEIAADTPNAFFDVASSMVDLDLVEKLVDGVGADRVLFGTDLPFLDCRMQIGRMAFSRLDDQQLAQVLAGNARRLFGI
jgi:predicted TIM-barrel fold metal-dependent hydrolase